MKLSIILISFTFLSIIGFSQEGHNELYRPQIHFSPDSGWMNDPNGMVYHNGTYHLFFQHYPDKSVWGPMHWGHAISKDLIHWQRQPIALYPDSLGYIFSGSAVADIHNTSGFGKNGKIPIVAIFTHHNDALSKTGSILVENQSLAYSVDEGKTWTKYSNNPVIKNPGISDFRDPKVMWFEGEKKWIMTLATKNCVTFYSSKNLKEWVKETAFGEQVGDHGGVWECPDLFSFNDGGKKIWVLTVSINPGAPNGGSGTQYFVGDFNGHAFTPFETNTKWIDYGPDNYASVTWSNTDKRIISFGWMSNWQYAGKVPTEKWRSANTIPRELGIQKVKNSYYLTSKPVPELNNIVAKKQVIESVATEKLVFNKQFEGVEIPAIIQFSLKNKESFSFELSNDMNEVLKVGFDKSENRFYIDRSHAGKNDFDTSFIRKSFAPGLSDKPGMNITLVIDNTSIELFADNGLSVMTETFFPNKPFNRMELTSSKKLYLKNVVYKKLNNIWN